MGLVAIVIAVLVLLLVAGLLLKLGLALLWYLLVGLLIGAVARLVVPGRREMGFGATALYGAAGALLAGIVANILDAGLLIELVLAVLAAAALIVLIGERSGRDGPV